MSRGEPKGREAEPADRDLGVALSGGGHRAALFTLGALLYLVDSGANRRVATITSVSGGSITNGLVAQECDFGTVGRSEFNDVAAKLVGTIVYRGAVSPTSLPVAGYLGLLLAGATWVIATCFFSWPIGLPGWACLLQLLLWGTLVLLRGTIVAVLLRRAFFLDARGHPTDLTGTRNRTADQVICATDLTSPAPLYFICGRPWPVYSPLYKGSRRRVRLGDAVRASAALPGLIPPRLYWALPPAFLPKRWRAGWQAVPTPNGVRRPPAVLLLADGGVWNNLGTQYFERDGEPDLPFYAVEEAVELPIDDPGKLLIVDGSGIPKPSRGWKFLLPLAAEVLGLSRVLSVLYANTVRPRLRNLYENERAFWRWGDQFDPDWDVPKVPVSISIRDDRQAGRLYGGFELPRSDHARGIGERGRAWATYSIPDVVCPSLDGFPTKEELRARCASVGTHLSTVDQATATALLVLGYVETMRAMSVTYGTPLVQPFPSEDRFTRLSEPRAAGSPEALP